MISRAFVLVICVAAGLSGCTGLYGHDEIDRYFQRSESITLSAGEARNANIANQTIHPWPPGVSDRRIVADGPRSVSAVERYRKGEVPPDPLPKVRQRSEQPLGKGAQGTGSESTSEATPNGQ